MSLLQIHHYGTNKIIITTNTTAPKSRAARLTHHLFLDPENNMAVIIKNKNPETFSFMFIDSGKKTAVK